MTENNSKPFASPPAVHPPRLLEMTCGWPGCSTRFQFYLADSAVCPVCIRRSIVLFDDVDSGRLEPTDHIPVSPETMDEFSKTCENLNKLLRTEMENTECTTQTKE